MLITESDILKFLGLRIPLETQLYVAGGVTWLTTLTNNSLTFLNLVFLWTLLELLPMSYRKYHTTAHQFEDHWDAYNVEEFKFKSMLVPFDEKPISMHISTFMTRDKASSNTRRTIMDLSCPKVCSVNDRVGKNTYLHSEFELH